MPHSCFSCTKGPPCSDMHAQERKKGHANTSAHTRTHTHKKAGQAAGPGRGPACCGPRHTKWEQRSRHALGDDSYDGEGGPPLPPSHITRAQQRQAHGTLERTRAASGMQDGTGQKGSCTRAVQCTCAHSTSSGGRTAGTLQGRARSHATKHTLLDRMIRRSAAHGCHHPTSS